MPLSLFSAHFMKKRTQITASDLFVRLERAFLRRRPRECGACAVPLPFHVSGSREGEANWQIVPPADCGHGCSQVLEEIVAEQREVYDLVSDGRTH
jgi:hypothetical protein